MNRQQRRSKGAQHFQQEIDKTLAEHGTALGLVPGDDLGELTSIMEAEFLRLGMALPRPLKLSWVDGKVFIGLQEP